MKKSDLKKGMRVRLKNGRILIVIRDYETARYEHQDILFADDYGFMPGDDYGEDLLYRDDDYSVSEVYANPGDSHFLDVKRKGEFLWERPEPKEMTLADIEAELGYPVKIIGK